MLQTEKEIQESNDIYLKKIHDELEKKNKDEELEKKKLELEKKKQEEKELNLEKKRQLQRKIQSSKPGVSIGMTSRQVIEDSSWGKPQSVNRTTNQYGVREQWVYGGRNYLYFENGKLTSIQN